MRCALTISGNYRGARWRSVRLCHDLHLSMPLEEKEKKIAKCDKEERRKVRCGWRGQGGGLVSGGVDVAVIKTGSRLWRDSEETGETNSTKNRE